MYTPPGQRRSPSKRAIPEGPIHDLCLIIESTAADVWQTRTNALKTLVDLIPSDSEYNTTQAWYNSPTTLRHLAYPLSELLKDPRSTVVKRTCEYLTDLFQKCQVDARYLLKDLMPAILSVHAQTVVVIRTAVQEMVVDSLRVVPCKMTMPMWLEKLKSDKSRTVREACALYLGVGLLEWTDAGYLTKEIWNQVTTSLVRALRDPAPPVRKYAKRGLETVQAYQPDILANILQNKSLTRDSRVKRLLERIQSGESSGDDNVSLASSRVGGSSVVSGRSYSAFGSNRSVSGRDQPSPVHNASGGQGQGGSALSRRGSGAPGGPGIPTNIAVQTGENAQPRVSRLGTSSRSGLGPPVRMTKSSTTSTGPFRSAVESPARQNAKVKVPPASAVGVVSITSFDTIDEPSLPVIANKVELRQQAARRRNNSRRSSLLQQRISRSTTNLARSDDSNQESNHSTAADQEMLDDLLGEDEKVNGSGTPVASSAMPTTDAVASNGHRTNPEHWGIANEILEAHKNHVDHIMETLRLEMDALKDFEQVLMDDSLRPDEDEVLDYFESVALCLDQRTTAGNILRRAMDRISKGTENGNHV